MSKSTKLAMKIIGITALICAMLGIDIRGWSYGYDHFGINVVSAVMIPVTVFLAVVAIVIVMAAKGEFE